MPVEWQEDWRRLQSLPSLRNSTTFSPPSSRMMERLHDRYELTPEYEELLTLGYPTKPLRLHRMTFFPSLEKMLPHDHGEKASLANNYHYFGTDSWSWPAQWIPLTTLINHEIYFLRADKGDKIYRTWTDSSWDTDGALLPEQAIYASLGVFVHTLALNFELLGRNSLTVKKEGWFLFKSEKTVFSDVAVRKLRAHHQAPKQGSPILPCFSSYAGEYDDLAMPP